MKKQELRNLYLVILSLFILNKVHAFDLDMTVDDEIRKNYNSLKLIQDTHTESVHDSLPDLPEISDTYESNVPKNVHTPKDLSSQIIVSNGTKISSGTSFNVINATRINDWLKAGNNVKFYTSTPIIKKKYVIPSNTTFAGKIVEVHQPQITCNGGLVVIQVNSMTINGQTIPIRAYITRANDKKIFLNNIKGQRTYLKTVWKKGNWGRTLFNKMLTLTINLGGEGSTVFLSPFPFAYGTICLGLNALTSPICAFFTKGGHISIPAGSNFRIKLLDDVYIN